MLNMGTYAQPHTASESNLTYHTDGPSGGRPLQRITLSPGKIGDIARAILVLVQFGHKMIT
jgi:hypothetical protein